MDGPSKNNIAENGYSNLESYLSHYDAELRLQYPDDLESRLAAIEIQLRSSLSITTTTNIDRLPDMLKLGLEPHAARMGDTNNSSAILPADHAMGLNTYCFANIGYCPAYGEENRRVSILLDDNIINNPHSFFTWTDLGATLSGLDLPNYDPRVIEYITQYEKEKLPLSSIYKVLSRTFLKAGKNVDDFLLDPKHRFPPAYNPDLVTKNWGNPEIKIAGKVGSESFKGFVVTNSATFNDLISLGIDEQRIILSQGVNNLGKQMADFKLAQANHSA